MAQNISKGLNTTPEPKGENSERVVSEVGESLPLDRMLEMAEKSGIVCHWADEPALSYLYFRRKGRLPPSCVNCWETHISFRSRETRDEFLKNAPPSLNRKVSRKVSDAIQTRFGIRYFVRDRMHGTEADVRMAFQNLNQAARRMGLRLGVDYWIGWDRACGLWRDLFPEISRRKNYTVVDPFVHSLRISWDSAPATAEERAKRELESLKEFESTLQKSIQKLDELAKRAGESPTRYS
jgi:hypothetical protein